MSAATELSEEANAELSRILMSGSSDPRANEVKSFGDAVDVLKRAALKKKYDNLIVQIDEYNSSDEETYKKTVAESLKVKFEMDKLKRN